MVLRYIQDFIVGTFLFIWGYSSLQGRPLQMEFGPQDAYTAWILILAGLFLWFGRGLVWWFRRMKERRKKGEDRSEFTR